MISRSTILRRVGAAALAVALLLPPAAAAWGPVRLPGPGGNPLAALWDLFLGLFKGGETENHGTIDPNGSTDENGIGIDPDGSTGEDRAGIDPDGAP